MNETLSAFRVQFPTLARGNPYCVCVSVCVCMCVCVTLSAFQDAAPNPKL
jgi:hypothetical protein